MPCRIFAGLLLAVLLSLGAAPLHAGRTTLTPWRPVFKGIDHAIGTNVPGAGASFDNQMVMHVMRVDTSDPDIRFLPTPRILVNYASGARETAGYTVTQFLRTNKVQLAINANFFNPTQYYLPPGTPMDVSGLFISQGDLVSQQNSRIDSSSLLIDGANRAHFVMTNWPAASTAGISNAVSGQYPVVVAGINIGRQYLSDPDTVHDVQPRTIYGLSKDRRFLYLMTIDGRQSPYSTGALDWEGAGWMLMAGAYEAANMDGGGSTTLVMETSTGGSVEVNHSSAVADSGKERTVGAHFGVFAKPVPGVINDVIARADDDAATILWTTTSPSTSQVEYGTTPGFGLSTALNTTLVTNHAVLLTNLLPNTGYYFRAHSSIGANAYASSNLFFTTSNYVTTNLVVDFPSTWKYTVANLDGLNWTDRTYNDSLWEGSGQGLLLVDLRGLNPDIQPQGASLPTDPGTQEPYITYYFRTHFDLPSVSSGTSIVLTGYIDDGAVVHLNGTEISRLRMEDAPTTISNQSLAVTFPCDGDATCLDGFDLPLGVGSRLRAGDNVLSVEVHNYDPNSADITFGLQATVTDRIALPPRLLLSTTNGTGNLDWTAGGYVLQQAPNIDGPWTTLPGPIAAGPYPIPAPAGGQIFYRLWK
ncbi:MAG TPA: phosphodiester glycosidase family protein [Candidatus Limnocylindria bacterium]|nr:phosphodiester glycosidase family protein [Candidatus Limnocylindria bacterium]